MTVRMHSLRRNFSKKPNGKRNFLSNKKLQKRTVKRPNARWRLPSKKVSNSKKVDEDVQGEGASLTRIISQNPKLLEIIIEPNGIRWPPTHHLLKKIGPIDSENRKNFRTSLPGSSWTKLTRKKLWRHLNKRSSGCSTDKKLSLELSLEKWNAQEVLTEVRDIFWPNRWRREWTSIRKFCITSWWKLSG